ncbi:MAG: ATP-grasp domain-containing protein [Nitriliruptor sp.]|nr:MAG: ATP-grasp domain-containing protein [Nitriliruptor sp.]
MLGGGGRSALEVPTAGPHGRSREDARVKHLAVIGLSDRQRDWLQRIGDEHGFRVYSILPYAKVRRAKRFHLEELLTVARARLDAQPVDGITTFWDFPSSCLAAILAEEVGLPTPGLRAVVSFEHKYWSRLVQQKVAPRHTPTFVAVDPFDESVLDGDPPLPFPFWLKPVKSYSGHLGFRVRSPDELHEAITVLRGGIHRLGVPFQRTLDHLDELPARVDAVGGSGAIAEEPIDGKQCTLEGHVWHGEVHIHGIFDIHRGEDRSTFTHYTYPSQMSAAARARMCRIATDLVTEVGYDSAPFNIEFFVDEDEDRTSILEVNPRISQEHSYLMDWVDDATNLQVMAQTALDEEPTLHPRDGPCRMAAKFFLRRTEDAVVAAVPDEDRIAEIERRHAPCVVELLVDRGGRLSQLEDQEPYSYLLAYVYLGGDGEQELHQRYRQVVAELGLRFDAIG